MKWRCPWGDMPLPDDMPKRAFLPSGRIRWSHGRSALINKYIKFATSCYAAIPKERRDGFKAISFNEWARNLPKKDRRRLSMTQASLEDVWD